MGLKSHFLLGVKYSVCFYSIAIATLENTLFIIKYQYIIFTYSWWYFGKGVSLYQKCHVWRWIFRVYLSNFYTNWPRYVGDWIAKASLWNRYQGYSSQGCQVQSVSFQGHHFNGQNIKPYAKYTILGIVNFYVIHYFTGRGALRTFASNKVFLKIS